LDIKFLCNDQLIHIFEGYPNDNKHENSALVYRAMSAYTIKEDDNTRTSSVSNGEDSSFNSNRGSSSSKKRKLKDLLDSS
jgi:hypothetical protein